ncbi:maltose acetyltransferase domain-containing protein [Agrilactobacillus yilanensis]|uniref:Maltose acetyltransferase domain-containing protein n=1 Tax=Agrilactobacillus yilanensis TaxID=2485997 RepID=A0ABW4J4S1_9LACO|nr:maltose acetyltransferase domain-containing protein [Agrilactobacillus yilanensis]
MTKQATIDWFHRVSNSGEIYDSNDPDLLTYQHELMQRLVEYNQTAETPIRLKQRAAILAEIVGNNADTLFIIPPIPDAIKIKYGLTNPQTHSNTKGSL